MSKISYNQSDLARIARKLTSIPNNLEKLANVLSLFEHHACFFDRVIYVETMKQKINYFHDDYLAENVLGTDDIEEMFEEGKTSIYKLQSFFEFNHLGVSFDSKDGSIDFPFEDELDSIQRIADELEDVTKEMDEHISFLYYLFLGEEI